ncbi:MAG: hypothetical protein IKR48_00910, partial [Kiritimatiellae bacterium]|nr:hypothetical protein [Kiritimatiellia bacterium]
EVCRVPLVIGVEYAVTSSVPFTVSPAYDTIGRTPDYTLIIEPREGGGTTVHWPIRFSYVETTDETHFTLDAYPGDLGLEYSWHVDGGMQPQPMPMLMSPLPRLLSSGGDGGCFQTDGSNITMVCVGNCGCDGCTLGGYAYLMGHSFSLPTFQCGCEPPHDPDPEEQDEPDPSLPSIPVSYSASAVIYEAAYVDSPGHTVSRRSTPVSLNISVSGGSHGGHYSVSMPGFGKLVPTEPVNIPMGGYLAPYETVWVNVNCEGFAPSSSEEDVKISGTFVENGTGCRFTSNGSKLTVFRVELQPKVDPPDLDYASPNRHTYGVCELVDRIQVPSQPVITWDLIGGGAVVYDEEFGRFYYRCPLNGCQNPLRAGYCGVTYIPSINVLEPNSIIAELRYGMTMASVFTTNTVTVGMAGGIGVKLKLYVTPLRVSFSGIAVQEVVSFTYEAEGYFLNPYFNGAFAHTGGIGGAGAGRWGDVQDDNFYAFDTAAYADRIPWLTPDGHVTNDVAFAWTSGYVRIDNPFGWNLKGTSGTNSPFKRFGEEIQDEFILFTDGTVGARKLNKQATRTTNGVIRLNGVLMQ